MLELQWYKIEKRVPNNKINLKNRKQISKILWASELSEELFPPKYVLEAPKKTPDAINSTITGYVISTAQSHIIHKSNPRYVTLN